MTLRILKIAMVGTFALTMSSAAFAEGRQVGQYSLFPEKTEELGNIMQMVFKTLNHSSRSYEHEVNDALVKMTLGHIQFAKDNDLLKEIVDDKGETERPMLARVAKMIKQTGEKELALKAVFEQTTCHFQLVLETEMQPGVRRFVSPFGHVLTQTVRMGQHDLTEEEIYNVWQKPLYERYGEILGVPLEVDPWDPETRLITVRIKDFEQVSMR
ncbi:MAG: hypothetical protein P8L79_08445 [Rhodospirillaceae bacterium]|jgi:hypothetical protein|nr:hypothetical protein [Rhodospirillaceae bacterium]